MADYEYMSAVKKREIFYTKY